MNAVTVQELTGPNYTTIKVDDTFYVTSIYDEPGGNTNRKLIKLYTRLGNNDNDRQHMVGGDVNAQSEA